VSDLWYAPPALVSHDTAGRYATLTGVPEMADLRVGQDFRRPEYRREVFLRFYEFHLRHRSHPGGVYLLMPYLRQNLAWDDEQALWFAFLNGNTQHPITSLLIHRRFPTPNSPGLEDWWGREYPRLEFDTDRRHQKGDFVASVACYRMLTRGAQADYFARLCGSSDPRANFRAVWAAVRRDFFSFGRLSTFSYLEYLRIMGLPLECNQLFLEDMEGSKSHRNGLAKVLGRDDLDWHESNPTGFAGQYTREVLGWLVEEAATLLREARRRIVVGAPGAEDVGYFTLESALCTYKSWHRPNRRYPNVYMDMLHDRIRRAERRWPDEDLNIFWQARRDRLPAQLRLEDNPGDPGLCPLKQNHYRHTGQVIMMDADWDCFRNDFNDGCEARTAAARAALQQGLGL